MDSLEHSGELSPDDALYRIRHSLAHVLAQAVLELRPGSTLGFGPPIKDGFYYDFILSAPITEEDFPEIEQRMRKILKKGQRFEREELPKEAALARLGEMKEPYKREYALELFDKKRPADAVVLSQRSVPRHVRRAARAHHEGNPARRIQAAERRRRVLARRFQERDDDAHLRVGIREQGRARRSTSRATSWRSRATTRSSGANWVCITSTTTSVRGCRCGCRTAR